MSDLTDQIDFLTAENAVLTAQVTLQDKQCAINKNRLNKQIEQRSKQIAAIQEQIVAAAAVEPQADVPAS